MKHTANKPFLKSISMKKTNLFAANAVRSFFMTKATLISLNVLLLLLIASFEMKAQSLLPATQEIYSRIKVKTNPVQFAKMNAAIGFDHVRLEKDGSFIGEFSQSEIEIIKSLGAKINVLVPDIVKDL